MNVEVCQQAAAWEAYVNEAPEASLYHRWGWKGVIEETFGHETYYLAATSDGRIQGVLPLVDIRSRLFGRFLVSLPFSTYGGLLARTPEVRDHILRAAIELGRELGVQHIELRQGQAVEMDWQCATPKVTMVVSLPTTADELWRQLSSKSRQKVRFARKHGLRSDWDAGESATDEFYEIFALNMRNLGTPVYPRALFTNFRRYYPGEAKILTIHDGSKAHAAAFVTRFRETVEVPWSGSLPDSRGQHSVELMFWAIIEWATQQGYRLVDFGRCTRGSGVYKFKQLWLAEERPLNWYYWLAADTDLPALRPENPRYRWATQVWRRLPLAVTNRLGPRVVRCIP